MTVNLGEWGRRRPRLFPLAVLVSGLLLTALAALFLGQLVESQSEQRFEQRVARTHAAISDRLDTYVALLEAGVGLFAASDDGVTREEFSRFVRQIQPGARYPGIQGIGYTHRLGAESPEALATRMRAQGSTAFRLWPDTPRADYHAILYLEPQDARNRAAIGYDMFSEPVRRAAMERARDTGQPAASGPVELVQEIDEAKQPGFLLYLPVYAGGATPANVSERRARLQGYVYAPFRANDLLTGILGGYETQPVSFTVYDAEAENGLLSTSEGAADPRDRRGAERTLAVGGRTWTIHYSAKEDAWAESGGYVVPLVAAGGIIATLLLAFASFLQSQAWRRAMREVEEREEAERALRAANSRLAESAAEQAAVLSQLAEGVIVADPEGRITFVNEAARQMHGVSVLGVGPDGYARAYALFTEDGEPYPDDQLPLARAVRDKAHVADARWRIRRPDGSEVLASGTARPVLLPGGDMIGAVITIRDETRRVEAERALRALNETLEQRVAEALSEQARAEESLRQAQKMEAIGQLTGGIAHDFNNMLAVIVGSLDMARRRLEEREPRVGALLANAQEGARRAATLTQRLLAFSRRQPLAPETVDANALIAGMSELLARSIGETIRIDMQPAEDLWTTFADPNQLENVILNLAVNARDAMPEGGTLTISTANVAMDAIAAGRREMAPGDYVQIAVADTGTGMPPEIVARAFEPFFTTKPVGKGTGLGLSQVYGFLRQTGGHARIHSEEGRGTSISLYLPRHLAPGEAPSIASQPAADMPRGRPEETILVVEDEVQVRAMSVAALGDLGYHVLEAENPAHALEIARTNGGIQLLFTDVVMPEMNGRALADAVRALDPSIAVLFTTGYTRDAIVQDGRFEQGIAVLAKPFTMEQLAVKVRETLDGRQV